MALDGKGIFVSDLCSDNLGFPPRPVSSEGALEVCAMSVVGLPRPTVRETWLPQAGFLRSSSVGTGEVDLLRVQCFELPFLGADDCFWV